ncbi:MAG: EAL domain-containing protein [Gammaproteobacteria bacterium]|nr:EAL domain-containing protein [Gammaproteobacteria bacterium]
MSSDSEKLIRLLIVDEGMHQAEVLTSALRGAGLHVLTEFAEDEEDMTEILGSKPLEVVLFSLQLSEIDLAKAQQLIRDSGRHLAMIALTNEPKDTTTLAAMKMGAQDVVNSDSHDLLALVIQREAQNIKTWRKVASREAELHESEKRCTQLLASSKDAVAYVHEGLHIYANDAYLELLGYTDFDEIEAMPLIDMVGSEQQDEVKNFLRDFNQDKTSTNKLSLKLTHQSGEAIEGLLEFSRASYDGEPCTQILIRLEADTSELEEQISYLHQHDLVTGLYNHQFFMERLQQSIDEAMNGTSQTAMQYMAIDNFQNIRETVGISGCDILINDIAGILKQQAGDNALVARIGSYSYCILHKSQAREDLTESSNALLKQIEEHISEIGNRSITATCSLAIYHIDQNSPNNTNEIMARAERTLDGLHAAGGNQAKVYQPVAGEMTQEEEDAEIVKYIKTAISKNTIAALYQPIVGIGGQNGERYEISKQIPTENGKLLTEADYLPAAERTGSAKTLDRWAIVSALKQIAEAAKVNRKLNIFIPLSSDALQDATLARWVSDRLKSTKIPGEQLVFMFNEAHAVSQLKAVKNLYKSFKQLHCQIAIDGFGTGLNPFQLVKHIPPDYLRVNTAFIDGLATNNDNQQSIREISDQASSMDISCIIPGVVDAGVLSVLWGVGADYVQGDFLQGPSEDLNYDFSSMTG